MYLLSCTQRVNFFGKGNARALSHCFINLRLVKTLSKQWTKGYW